MPTYEITISLDDPVYNGETTERWSGWDEQVAIAQCFLYHAQNGARELKVLEIKKI